MKFYQLDKITYITEKSKYVYITIYYTDGIKKYKITKRRFYDLYTQFKKRKDIVFYPLLKNFLRGQQLKKQNDFYVINW